MTTKYEKIVNLLTNKEKFFIKLGLERISEVLAVLGNPQEKLKIIHVAGTNGKGSVCNIISTILNEAGLKIGLFTSPHLEKYNERIKINGSEINDNDFYNILLKVDSEAKQHNINLTEFELITAVAFVYFEENKVDFAVIEVGLGGRYDATNIAKNPILSVITSISLDHLDRLGDTIEKIAFEKAGIIKQNTTCIVAENNAGVEVIKDVAKSKQAKIIEVPKHVKIKNLDNHTIAEIAEKSYEFALNGAFQSENLDLALAAINHLRTNCVSIPESAIENGLKNVKHGARFEIIKELNLIIDGAHNIDGATLLRKSLDKAYKNLPINFIYATISTKDYKSILKELIRFKDTVTLHKFSHPSAVPPDDLAKVLQVYPNSVKIAKNKEEIMNIIRTNIHNESPTVLTGSLYAIGDLYSEIKFLKKKYSPGG